MTLSPEFCMVVEDNEGIVGYVTAALNVKSFHQKMLVSWIPELQSKYPLTDITNDLPASIQVCLFNYLSSEIFVSMHVNNKNQEFINSM